MSATSAWTRPESVKLDTPVQYMAQEASAANEALVAGREVVLERDVSDTDQYDRLLRMSGCAMATPGYS